MADAKRELSGFFLSAGKFASHVEALASPCCTTSYLRLFHNEPHHTAAVLDALTHNASVTALDIFELDAESATALAGLLSASPRLVSLAVHHPYGLDAVQNLCRGIATNRTLTRLHLAHLEPRGVAALADALLSWPPPSPSSAPADAGGAGNAAAVDAATPSARLHRLRLERCSFTPETAAALSAALGHQAGTLAELEVVGSELGDASAEALLDVPAWGRPGKAGALAGLDLSTCHVGPRGAAALGRLLAASRSLHSLNLANNKALGCEGAKVLAASLVNNRALRRLDLSGCGVGATGVQALAAALALQPGGDGGAPDGDEAAARPPLEHLVLTDNAAAAAGLVALLRSMAGPRPCALRALHLERNHIRCAELLTALGLPTAAAAAAPQPVPTAATLSQAPDLPRVAAPLEQLSLAGNALYDAGVAVLASCLAAVPCLEQLDLRENGISDAGVAALLPLIAPRAAGGGGGRGSGGGAPSASMLDGGLTAAPSAGLQGLLVDGNRLHNAGGQALLAAVMAAPWLWRFSAEANKLTDPALRLSLTQLSQMRAARHSQLAVAGRYYSSSSSSSEEGGHRGSGGGAGGGSGDGNEATSPMDLDGGGGGAPAPRPQGRGGCSRAGPAYQQQEQPNHYHHHHHKHRLEESDATEGDVSSGDVQRQPGVRNVAARGAEEGYAGGLGACDGGGGGAAFATSGAAGSRGFPTGRPMALDVWQCVPTADPGRDGGDGGGGGYWCGARVIAGCNGPTADPSSRDRFSCGGGGSSTDCGSCDDTPMRRASSGGASAASSGANVLALCGSPPPAVCFMKVVAAAEGVGGAAAVGASKRFSSVGDSDTPAPARAAAAAGALPQQLLPACRRPRYKPLTAEQQRLFADF